jgi:t-SNARE complex subunit (syntaxin)
MIDPVSALAAVQSAVKLIKQASKTVDDVASLGPMIGKYFDAKATATKAAKEAKKAGGSNMGKAIEIELALKQQADFEKELQSLFFQTNNMDVWQNIMKRVAEMNAADSEQAKKDAIADAKAKRKQEELNEIILVVGVLLVVFVVVGVVGYNAWDYCQTNRCGK